MPRQGLRQRWSLSACGLDRRRLGAADGAGAGATAVRRYADPAWRSGGLERSSPPALREPADDAEPGSDRQLDVRAGAAPRRDHAWPTWRCWPGCWTGPSGSTGSPSTPSCAGCCCAGWSAAAPPGPPRSTPSWTATAPTPASGTRQPAAPRSPIRRQGGRLGADHQRRPAERRRSAPCWTASPTLITTRRAARAVRASASSTRSGDVWRDWGTDMAQYFAEKAYPGEVTPEAIAAADDYIARSRSPAAAAPAADGGPRRRRPGAALPSSATPRPADPIRMPG